METADSQNQGEQPEETLTSLNEKRDALVSLVNSRGWEVLVELLGVTKGQVLNQALRTHPMESEGLWNAYNKGYYQGLEKVEELPQVMIDYAKQMIKEAEEENRQEENE